MNEKDVYILPVATPEKNRNIFAALKVAMIQPLSHNAT